MIAKYIKALFVFAILFTSCKNEDKSITSKSDYDKYLGLADNESFKSANEDYQFWKSKLYSNPNQFPYLVKLAAAQTQLFKNTGIIDYLVNAQNNLVEANEITHYKNAAYIRALARNYIAQHKFKEALNSLVIAEVLGENLKATQKMLFDVYLELGNTNMASNYLEDNKNLSDFDYLVRVSKWSDHEGDLDAAILYMEKAMRIAETSNLKGLKQWTYTNIADYYGHAGDISKSYMHYLKALEIDPNDAYAKKGIAWILYSHERNPEGALLILDDVQKTNNTPDYHLLKAEIAEYMNDESTKKSELKNYTTTVQNELYGDMYNAYNVALLAEELDIDAAISIAKIEVKNRPTALSYDLLAWAYFKKGKLNRALEIIEEHVVNKTYEPAVLYHIAKIYKAAGKTELLKPLKEELLDSLYELGPTMERKIQAI